MKNGLFTVGWDLEFKQTTFPNGMRFIECTTGRVYALDDEAR